MTTAYPPSVHHTSTHLSTRETLALLSAYLSAATTTDPSLHPGARLTEHGPVAPTSGPNNAGLALHHLRRVEAGLRGENLGEEEQDLTVRRKEDGGDDDDGGGLLGSMVMSGGGGAGEHGRGGSGFKEGQGDDDVVVEEVGGGGGGEWQDKAEFERQQEVVRGGVGKRDSAVEGGFEGEGGGHVPRVKTTWGPGDKDAKRRAKKERRKKYQLEEAARRQREKDAEQG